MSKSIDKLQKEVEAIQKELEDLQKFRDIPSVRKLRRHLQGELSYVKSEISIITTNKGEKEKKRVKIIEIANRNRSSKNKRTWNYVKAIQRNYRPDLSLKEIRSQLKLHRKGLETDISDIAWRNASP